MLNKIIATFACDMWGLDNSAFCDFNVLQVNVLADSRIQLLGKHNGAVEITVISRNWFDAAFDIDLEEYIS